MIKKLIALFLIISDINFSPLGWRDIFARVSSYQGSAKVEFWSTEIFQCRFSYLDNEIELFVYKEKTNTLYIEEEDFKECEGELIINVTDIDNLVTYHVNLVKSNNYKSLSSIDPYFCYDYCLFSSDITILDDDEPYFYLLNDRYEFKNYLDIRNIKLLENHGNLEGDYLGKLIFNCSERIFNYYPFDYQTCSHVFPLKISLKDQLTINFEDEFYFSYSNREINLDKKGYKSSYLYFPLSFDEQIIESQIVFDFTTFQFICNLTFLFDDYRNFIIEEINDNYVEVIENNHNFEEI